MTPLYEGVDTKPSDWEHVYTAEVDGKTLEAMKFLAWYVLKSELPSLSAIGAADCLLCFQEDVRIDSLKDCVIMS